MFFLKTLVPSMNAFTELTGALLNPPTFFFLCVQLTPDKYDLGFNTNFCSYVTYDIFLSPFLENRELL